MAIWEIPRPDRFARRRRRHVSGSIRYDDPRTMRSVRYEDPGAVDGPWDRDERNPNAAADNPNCAIPWVHDGYTAIEVYIDPAVGDRAPQVCEAVNAASGGSIHVDVLAETAFRALERLNLSPTLYDDPPDRLSSGMLAFGVTVG
jgi:hypothetical protein